mmetsp:Transcript_68266/g.109201  ORF Transcript_68266/g.109201 Transcript_68266/m.109201 type:complete len:245 (+) Transcript_68266:596-1330(+)
MLTGRMSSGTGSGSSFGFPVYSSMIAAERSERRTVAQGRRTAFSSSTRRMMAFSSSSYSTSGARMRRNLATSCTSATPKSLYVRLSGLPSSSRTNGFPVSPALERLGLMGTRNRCGTPKSATTRSPDPVPNGCTRSPLTSKYAMFSTTEMQGTRSRENMRMPLATSTNARFCGVVTMTAAVMGTIWPSVSWMSPVPGGMSMIRYSSSPQLVVVSSCCTSPDTIGPRMIALPCPAKPNETHLTPS